MSLPCPHCKKETISWWEKYKAAKFAIIYCPACGGRICTNPYIMPFYTLLYVWDVLFFGLATYLERNPIYILVMLVIWLILDWFSLYFPLSALKPKAQVKNADESESHTPQPDAQPEPAIHPKTSNSDGNA